MKNLLLTCLSAMLIPSAHAQISFGPELGLNVSSYYGKYAGIRQTSISSIIGGRLGGVADFGLGDHASLQPGLFYTMNGSKLMATSRVGNAYSYSFRVNTLELPVNLFYKTGRKDGSRFFFGGGPYAGLNLNGKIKSDIIFGGSSNVAIGSDTLDHIKRFDVGIGISAGYRLLSGMFIHVHFQNSLINLQPYGNTDNTMMNRNYGISIGYLFGKHIEPKSKGTHREK